MNLLDLSDKTILITGGAGAIGQVVVQMLAEHGAAVAANDVIGEAQALQVFHALGANSPRVRYFQADATQPETVAGLFDRVEASQGLPDIVCCHAGMVEAHPVEAYAVERFDRLMQLNLRSAFVVAQAAAQRWIAANRPGHLIFTTSWVQDVP
jgi:NAD(P)-dependent dehydrogenase (short-subunit alcohol dehydrogenase family)